MLRSIPTSRSLALVAVGFLAMQVTACSSSGNAGGSGGSSSGGSSAFASMTIVAGGGGACASRFEPHAAEAATTITIAIRTRGISHERARTCVVRCAR